MRHKLASPLLVWNCYVLQRMDEGFHRLLRSDSDAKHCKKYFTYTAIDNNSLPNDFDIHNEESVILGRGSRPSPHPKTILANQYDEIAWNHHCGVESMLVIKTCDERKKAYWVHYR